MVIIWIKVEKFALSHQRLRNFEKKYHQIWKKFQQYKIFLNYWLVSSNKLYHLIISMLSHRVNGVLYEMRLRVTSVLWLHFCNSVRQSVTEWNHYRLILYQHKISLNLKVISNCGRHNRSRFTIFDNLHSKGSVKWNNIN